MAVADTLALSAGTLMASADTPYRLVPAHFYPCRGHKSNTERCKDSDDPNANINPKT